MNIFVYDHTTILFIYVKRFFKCSSWTTKCFLERNIQFLERDVEFLKQKYDFLFLLLVPRLKDWFCVGVIFKVMGRSRVSVHWGGANSGRESLQGGTSPDATAILRLADDGVDVVLVTASVTSSRRRSRTPRHGRQCCW